MAEGVHACDQHVCSGGSMGRRGLSYLLETGVAQACIVSGLLPSLCIGGSHSLSYTAAEACHIHVCCPNSWLLCEMSVLDQNAR